jgi:hypothetical protein
MDANERIDTMSTDRTSPPAATLAAPTRPTILEMAKRWMATNTITLIPITYDRLIAMGLTLLNDTVPQGDADALATVVATLNGVQ